MKMLKNWGRALIAALLIVAGAPAWAVQTGTAQTQAALYDSFCDQCLTQNLSIRNLIASVVLNTTGGSAVITGGTINGATIGATSPSTGAFTTLAASSAVSGTGFSTYLASPPAIGGTVPAAGTFTTLTSSGAAITGGTISGATGVPIVLNAGGIPFISLSSGSVSAVGAISAITALPRIYPDAYCYFPANALATSIAAGWRYCTFSSTTVGVAFLDSYTSGKPTIPASPTAVTDGKGAFTGDTGEEFGLTLTVPILTATASIRYTVMFEATNNADVKTANTRLSGNSGTIFIAEALASQPAVGVVASISNMGSVSKQQSAVHGIFAANPSTTTVLGTVNTGVSTSLVFSLTKAIATDNVVMLPPIVEVVQ